MVKINLLSYQVRGRPVRPSLSIIGKIKGYLRQRWWSVLLAFETLGWRLSNRILRQAAKKVMKYMDHIERLDTDYLESLLSQPPNELDKWHLWAINRELVRRGACTKKQLGIEKEG